MKEIKGVQISPGVAVGPVYYFDRGRFRIPKHRISSQDVEEQLLLLQNAINKAVKELSQIRELVLDRLDEDHARMIDAQLMALGDTQVSAEVAGIVKNDLKNVTWAYFDVMSRYEEQLEKTLYRYAKERYIDLKDVKKRIIHHLSLKDEFTLPQLKEPSIYIASKITPAELIHINEQNVLGVVTETGGHESHAGILARSFQIPYVSHIPDVKVLIDHPNLIVDADNEHILLAANEQELEEYRQKAKKFSIRRHRTVRDLGDSKTQDGTQIHIFVNAGFVSEVSALDTDGLNGIGLYRTEFLCIEKNCIPEEDEQFQAYTKIVREMHQRPVTFRGFDFGRDKFIEMLDLEMFHQDDMFEDFGGIGFLLENPDVLHTQLRALLRTSAYGPIQIMFPMVSTIEEVRITKQMITEVQRELNEKGIRYDPNIPIGIMVETESILQELDSIAKEVDFFSIGTNDLSLFLLGADRETTYSRNDYHPVLYRAIQKILAAGKSADILVGVCGEMASDPIALLGLLGLGVRMISINPSAFREVYRVIRQVSIPELEPLAQKVLAYKSPFHAFLALRDYYREHVEKDNGDP